MTLLQVVSHFLSPNFNGKCLFWVIIIIIFQSQIFIFKLVPGERPLHGYPLLMNHFLKVYLLSLYINAYSVLQKPWQPAFLLDTHISSARYFCFTKPQKTILFFFCKTISSVAWICTWFVSSGYFTITADFFKICGEHWAKKPSNLEK